MKREATLAKDLDAFLNQLCLEWGFCSARAGDLLAANRKEISADAFTKTVLTAEGMNPEYEVEWRRRIRARFVERFGEAISTENFTAR